MAVEKRVTSPLLVRSRRLRGCMPAVCRRALQECRLQDGPCSDPAPVNLLFWCTLQEPSSIEKVAEVDEHVGVAMSGLTADARTLIDHGRVETQQHRFTYNEPMPLESLTQVRVSSWCRFLRGAEATPSACRVSAVAGMRTCLGAAAQHSSGAHNRHRTWHT